MGFTVILTPSGFLRVSNEMTEVKIALCAIKQHKTKRVRFVRVLDMYQIDISSNYLIYLKLHFKVITRNKTKMMAITSKYGPYLAQSRTITRDSSRGYVVSYQFWLKQSCRHCIIKMPQKAGQRSWRGFVGLLGNKKHRDDGGMCCERSRERTFQRSIRGTGHDRKRYQWPCLKLYWCYIVLSPLPFPVRE